MAPVPSPLPEPPAGRAHAQRPATATAGTPRKIPPPDSPPPAPPQRISDPYPAPPLRLADVLAPGGWRALLRRVLAPFKNLHAMAVVTRSVPNWSLPAFLQLAADIHSEVSGLSAARAARSRAS